MNTVLQTGGIIGILALVLLVFYASIISWIFTDARANSSQSAVLWALVGILAPLLGLVLYFLLVRDEYTPNAQDRPPGERSGGNNGSRRRPM